MRKIYNILIALTIFLSLFVVVAKSNIVNAATKQLDKDYSGTRDSVGNWVFTGYDSIYEESYYNSITATTKDSLVSQLRTLINKGTDKLSYGSYSKSDFGKTGTVIAECDEDPNNHSNCICLYTGVSYTKASGNSSWNQEHVWAKSHGFSTSGTNPYCDVMHLHVTEQKVNSSRSSKDFGDATGGTVFGSANNGGYDDRSYSSTWFEPRDSVKGDVARTMFYMEVRYGESFNLKLINLSTGKSSSGSNFGDLATLIKWHEEDPVDDFERRRNDVVEYYQGNRNPFIDHPEYANIIYGANYQGGGSTVDPNKPVKVTYNALTGVFSYTDNTEDQKGSLINAPTVEPTLAGYTFEGWYTNSNLTTKWDFATDKINSNITLYAKYTKNVTIAERFGALKAKAGISFDYKKTGEGTASTNKQTYTNISLSPTSGNGALSNLEENQEVDISQYFNLSGMDVKVYVLTNKKPNFYISTGEMRFYKYNGNGTALKVVSQNPNLKITAISAGTSSDFSCTVSPDGSFATVQNVASGTTGNIKLSEVKFSYEVGEGGTAATYEITNPVIKYQYTIEASLFNALLTLNEYNAVGIYYGELFYTGTVSEQADGSAIVTVSFIPASLTGKVEIKTAVKLDNGYYFGKTLNKSVQDIAKVYLAKYTTDAKVSESMEVLSYLANLA